MVKKSVENVTWGYVSKKDKVSSLRLGDSVQRKVAFREERHAIFVRLMNKGHHASTAFSMLCVGVFCFALVLGRTMFEVRSF